MTPARPWHRGVAVSAAWLRHHVPVAFVLGGAAFIAFGALSYNLAMVLIANLALIAEHGVMALRDGALVQLVELLVSGYGAFACYLVFKLCENIVVHWLSGIE